MFKIRIKLIIITALCLLFSNFVFAKTLYLPDSSSSQYLPTVKIFTYYYDSDGELIPEGYGSGTLIDSKGTILTNNHVVEDYYDPDEVYDAIQICLTKSNNPGEPICEFTASFIKRDPSMDLALLKMDSKDVRGNSINFDFYLPYENSGNYEVGSTITVIGFPDTGGSTVTFTSGLISGISVENGMEFLKTDADISFGNSGGTGVDKDGNFIGIPTYIIGSYSAEVLGYLFPLKNAVSWIKENINSAPIENAVVKEKLQKEIMRFINANETGIYINDYPPFEISLVEGWKFGNSLEGAFDLQSFSNTYSEGDSITMFPLERGDDSIAYVSVADEEYPYELSLDDVEDLLTYYIEEYSMVDEEISISRVELNEKYSAILVESSYVDWWYLDGVMVYDVNYAIPYGDRLIRINYAYTEMEEDVLTEIQEIVSSFTLDLDAIKSKSVDSLVFDDPYIVVKNPLSDTYLSDDSYDYDGKKYFGASFGKKDDYDFRVSIYSNLYQDESHIGDFDAFKVDTIADASEWYDIIASGDIYIDGHLGFFYTESYITDFGDRSFYTDIFLEGDEDDYFVIYYSADEEIYMKNLDDFETILNNIEFESQGAGQYFIPNFFGDGGIDTIIQDFSDIKNYIYESNVRALGRDGAFGPEMPSQFNPGSGLSRKDFLLWTMRTLQGQAFIAFEEFNQSYEGCGVHCFEDVDYNSDDGIYYDFAFAQGAIGGLSSDGNYYFKPDDQITMVAAFKMIFQIYSYPVWEAPEFMPWFVPYIHIAYSEGVVPYGVNSDDYKLSRGDGVYIIDRVRSFNLY
ncbi:S1C family serine protease [Patescibacteria group bacterium]